MTLRTALAAALLLALAAFPGAQAQAAGAPTTFWLHISSEPSYWVNPMQEDPDADGATGGYNPLGFVLGDPGVAEWSIPFTPGLASPLALDPAGQMVSTIYVGGNSAAGRVTITSELRLGSTVVATATAAAATVYSAGYQKVELTAPLQASSLDPSVGDPTWVIQAEGAGAQIFLSATTDRWTQFTLPVLGGAGAPEVRYHDLEGDDAVFSLEPTSPTNATHVYNWTTTLTAPELTLSGNRVAGNATVTVRDGANATVHAGVFDGNATSKVLSGAAGNWSITVELEGFAGNLSARLGAPPASPGSTSSSSGSSGPRPPGGPTATDSPSTGGTTSNSTDDGKKDSPAVALPALVGALVVLALVVRRRR